MAGEERPSGRAGEEEDETDNGGTGCIPLGGAPRVCEEHPQLDRRPSFESPSRSARHGVPPKVNAESRPSALASMQEIAHRASNRRVAVFLDYDGTLTPIVDNPWRAHLPEPARDAVYAIASVCPTAIISGRSREKVMEFVNLPGLYYAGSHGLDISAPNQHNSLMQPPDEVRHMMDDLHLRLSSIAERVPGAVIEHNRYCVSVHHRCCSAPDRQHLESLVEQELSREAGVRIALGRKVLEVRPNVEWDKGKALSYLMGEIICDSPSSCLPIYCGDDWTDEDAFRACKAHRGVSVVVSRSERQSEAEMSLRCPEETRQFLWKLAKQLQEHTTTATSDGVSKAECNGKTECDREEQNEQHGQGESALQRQSRRGRRKSKG